MSTHFHKLSVENIRTETAESVSIAFRVPDELKEKFKFIQGQNITIKAVVNQEEIRRSYSICSSPLENELRIAVKKIPNGKFSGYANTLKKNDELEILPPTGKFYTELKPSNKKNYIAFAAGSGITPVISIIKTTLGTERQSSFTLVYGNKNRHSIIFKEELEAIKNRYMDRFALHHIFSREKTDAVIYHGRISEEKCEALNDKLINIQNEDEFFLCGPEQMIFAIKEWLEKKGVDTKKIHFELFNVPVLSSAGIRPPDEAAAKTTQQVSKVTIRQDGVSFSFDMGFYEDSILTAALKQGVDLPYACKGGVCSTCRAKLTGGKIAMDHNYALEPDEMDKGFILTCQSHPRTERVIIDFDTK